jgi:hypothetical protein
MMKLLKRILKEESGQVLPMALVLLLLGGLLVVPTLAFMTTNLNANRQVDQANLRTYAADAGIHYAFQQFVHDANFNPDTGILEFPEESNPINGCDVSLAMTPVDDFTYRITSVAFNPASGKTTTIEAYFLANAEQFETGTSPFDFALATLGGDLTMTGGSVITSDCSPEPCSEGNVWVNGDINMSGSTSIEGDATVTGTCNHPEKIEGAYTPGSDPIGRPEWLDDKIDCYIANTDVARPEFSGQTWDEVYNTKQDWGWSGPYNHGSVRVNGNLTLSGTQSPAIYTFTGPVWVTGDLKISSGANYVIFRGPVRVDGYADFGGTGWVKFENPTPESTITYGYHAIGTEQGSGVHIADDSASVILTSGTCGSDGAVSVQLQDSYDNSIWTDVSPCGTLPLVTQINDNGICRQNYTGGKPFLRALATVSGATCQFGVSIVRSTTFHVGEYLKFSGSRSGWFDGPVVVNDEAATSSKIIDIGGSKFSGVAWDIRFQGTLRAAEVTQNCNHKIYFGGSKQFEFYDAVYTNVSAELAGATGSNMTFTKAFIADCDITVAGSSIIDAPPTTSPFFVSRYGDVEVEGATKVDAIVYAPEGNVHVSGSSELEGAIVSGSALLEGAVRLKYPVILQERDDVHDSEGGPGGEPGASTFSIISYSIQ